MFYGRIGYEAARDQALQNKTLMELEPHFRIRFVGEQLPGLQAYNRAVYRVRTAADGPGADFPWDFSIMCVPTHVIEPLVRSDLAESERVFNQFNFAITVS